LRILDSEKTWVDPLRNPAIFESLLVQGCRYCHADLMDVTGISVDRLGEKHVYAGVVPCCAICNRLKSDGLKTGGFTYEEMIGIIGPAVAEVRQRRKQTEKTK
jgi:hypothetical protein